MEDRQVSDSPAGSALKGRLPCGRHARKDALVFGVGALSCRCFFAKDVHRLVGAASAGGFNRVNGFGCGVRGSSPDAYRPFVRCPSGYRELRSVPPTSGRHPCAVKGEHASGNAVLGAGRYLWPRREGSMCRAGSVFTAVKRLQFFTVRGPLRHATVDLGCSCGSQNFKFLRGHFRPVEASLYFRFSSGRGIIAATWYPCITDPDVPAPKEI